MNKKRILSFLLAFIMAFTLIPVQGVFAVTLDSMETDVLAATSSAEAQQIYDTYKDALKGYTYEDLYTILKPSSYELSDAKNALKNETGALSIDKISDEEAKTRLMDRLDMEKAFQQVQEDLDVVMPEIIAGSNSSTATNILKNNKQQILLGLTYLYRYYGFSVGDDGTTAMDIILYHPDRLGLTGDNNALSILSSLGSMDYTEAKGSNTETTYTNKLSWVTCNSDEDDSLLAFLEKLAALDGRSSANEFLHKRSKATIVESGDGSSLFEKAKKDTRIATFLLPLLNLSTESVFIVSTNYTTTVGLTSTYGGADSEDFASQIERTAESQQSFLAFWERISTTKSSLDMEPDILVMDTFVKEGEESFTNRWSVETGEKADDGVREFITPVGRYSRPTAAGGIPAAAEAEISSNTIRFYNGKILTDSGINTYTHELTHIYDETVWLNGYGLRDTVNGETYATGLFEAENNTQPADGGSSSYGPMFNLNTAYELGSNRIQNKSPSRFGNTGDLQQYMQGVMDVTYTLDLIEAQEILKMSDADKAILFNRVKLVEDSTDTVNDPKRMIECFEGITEKEAAELETIDDLVDGSIVSGRLAPKWAYTKLTLSYSDYYTTVAMFEGVYAGLQNNDGAAGGFLFRRYAYELLGEYGWKDGFIAYISNRYDNDGKALNEILDDAYGGSMTTFKKAMYQRRADKLNKLKSTTYGDADAMRTIIREALEKDLKLMKQRGETDDSGYYMYGINNVQNVKKQIFQEYLLMTNDFRTSIYEASTEQVNLSEATISLSKTTYDYTGSAIMPDPVVTYNGTALTKGTDYTLSYSNNTKAGTATITVTGTGNYTGTKTITFSIVETDPTSAARGRLFTKNTIRAAGADRYATSIAAANAFKTSLGVQKFDNIIVACGANYPDALAGSYLAKVKNAPVILVNKTTASEKNVRTYINGNLKSGGTVYILGGPNAVTWRFQNNLGGIKVKRLSGNDRYETNLAILKEAGVTNQELLVCTGNGYADSLSASAAGRPILLVNRNKLTPQQKAYMNTIEPSKIYFIGGEAVVSKQMAGIMKGYCTNTERLGGADRYKTSAKVANEFFPGGSEAITLAYAQNFPDGLSGGPVALSIGAPLLLVNNSNYADARTFAQKMKTKKVVVMGGTKLISDGTVNKIVR